MAAPADVNLSSLEGKWVMNKTLSDDSDPLLALQGVSWFVRKAIALSTVTLQVTEYIDEDSHTHIDIDQTATGGIKGTTEKRCLDFVMRPHKDGIFGSVEAQSRWIKLDDVEATDPDEAKFLKGEGYGGGFLGGDSEGEEGKRHIQSLATNVDKGSSGGWTAEQIWGFEEIDDKRYYTRRVIIRKGDTAKKARLVYDCHGK